MTVKQTAGRDALGEFAPEFAHYNDDILFGENWNNEDIDLKTRCIVTVVALMAQGITDSSLAYHLANAKKAGVSRAEIAAVVTHAAFYAGWPKAWAVFNLAKEVWGAGAVAESGSGAEDDAADAGAGAGADAGAGVGAGGSAATGDGGRAALEAASIFPIGAPNDAYAQYFDGQSYLAPVCKEQVIVANVTFEPSCRNHWHIHHATQGGGQVLLCVAGRGWYQEWGKPARALRPGDVVNIPAEVKHWHGAAADSWFSHLAVEIAGENASNEWCEPVDPAQYAALG